MNAEQERPTSNDEEIYIHTNEETTALTSENPAIVYEPGTRGRPPIQETLDSEMLYPQPAQIASDISGYYSVDAFDLEEELEVIGIMDDGNGQLEILVMSVETYPAIVAEL
ncbi:Hypothetical predicted protein [Paramuricea clavata]|uniref:Uncharacterized protein n=1 Tax=Paramuricea clavata TaxID=317549 RepID=A0A6S7H8S0_PARCT|nr:Hypothetical predicted protein [Paramuricea clavata]